MNLSLDPLSPGTFDAIGSWVLGGFVVLFMIVVFVRILLDIWKDE